MPERTSIISIEGFVQCEPEEAFVAVGWEASSPDGGSHQSAVLPSAAPETYGTVLPHPRERSRKPAQCRA